MYVCLRSNWFSFIDFQIGTLIKTWMYCAPITGEFYSLIIFSRSTVCSQYILWMDISYLQTFAHTRLTCCVFFWRCVCVFVCLSIAVCLCKVGMWIILMPSLRFNLKYLPKMTCWFSLFKVFHLVIYANKKLQIFIFAHSWTHLFLDLCVLWLPVVHGA